MGKVKGTNEFLVIAFLLSEAILSIEAVTTSKIVNGQLFVDGQPFFINGIYTQQANATELQHIASLGFNTVLSYAYEPSGDDKQLAQYLDDCKVNELYALVSIKDLYPDSPANDQRWRDIVSTFKAHPAVIGWYINDEYGPDMVPQLTKRYQQVKAMDPDHIMNSVIVQNTVIGLYNTSSDVLGSDPYDWHNASYTTSLHYTLNSITDSVTAYQHRPDRATLCATQMHNRGIYTPTQGDTEPPYVVKLAMAMLKVVIGCQGQLQYSYFDQLRMLRNDKVVAADPATLTRRWTEMTQIVQTVNDNVPWFIGQDVSQQLKVVSNPGFVTWRAYQRDDGARRLYLINGNNTQASMTLKYNNGSQARFDCQAWQYKQLDL